MSDIQYEVKLPIKTISESNTRQHWTKESKRHKQQKLSLWAELHNRMPFIDLPCTVKFTRIAPRNLDAHENLPMSMKWLVDQMAEYLIPGKAAGRADDSKELKFIYDQEKGNPKEYAVKITVYRKSKCCCPCHDQSKSEGLMLC